MTARAEIIAVGTELLLGQIVNTNAQYLGQRLAEAGLNVFYHIVVGDNERRIGEQLTMSLARADVLVLCGGLGPTEDDVTREAVAKILNRKLLLHQDAKEVLERHFSGRQMPMNNFRQAHVPEGAVVLPNPHGTAPGLYLEVEASGKKRLIFLLPGPPRELQPMFMSQVMPRLSASGYTTGGIFSRTIRVSGLGESAVAERIEDLIREQTDPTIALYSRLGEVDVRLTTRGENLESARLSMVSLQTEIESRLAPYVYGLDQETLAGALGRALLTRGMTMATAESCTGGITGHLITNEPGSSEFYRGGMVCYSNESKIELLGVPKAVLVDHGAVSEPCVREMLRGALDRFNATAGLAITGIAGPGGGSKSKPVGTVYVAVGDIHHPEVVRLSMFGDRQAIKERSAKQALRLLLNWVRGAEQR